MAAITDISDLINLSTGGSSGAPENLWWFKSARVGGAAAVNPIAGRMTSLWQYEGSYGAGSAPTTGAIPTNATAGAIPFTSPAISKQKWLTQFGGTTNVSGTLILYDRLFHIGNLNGSTGSGTQQTVQGAIPSPALTRNTGGVGNMVFYEIYTQVGTTAVTLTMTYTDNDGNTGQTSPAVTFGGTNFREAQAIRRIPLAAGDRGVRAVASIALSGLGATGTAGAFGITIARPIAYLPLNATGILGFRDYATGLPGIPEIDSTACLSLMWMANTTTPPEPFGCTSFVEK